MHTVWLNSSSHSLALSSLYFCLSFLFPHCRPLLAPAQLACSLRHIHVNDYRLPPVLISMGLNEQKENTAFFKDYWNLQIPPASPCACDCMCVRACVRACLRVSFVFVPVGPCVCMCVCARGCLSFNAGVGSLHAVKMPPGLLLS